jgi:outer membrane protein OmpA-like peptidoglycan-associated protein
LQSCGLIGRSGARGCQPLQAKSVASLPSDDFNALFQPMRSRGGIVQFDRDASSLDPPDQELIDTVFSDQRGASYFFVVSRASPDGSVEYNRKLSQDRAEAVLSYLRERFNDPDLDREVGLLWLGEEFAQLDSEFCQWRRSGAEPDAADSASCRTTDLNRGAFISWIDCRL